MNKQELEEKANRCLACKDPGCVQACPINVNIPGFIAKIKASDIEGAYNIIKEKSYLGAICGRICAHETQCQGSCVRGIKEAPVDIGDLEMYVCDEALKNNHEDKTINEIKENGIKVAIIGSGPAGLACAVELRKLGYGVTIFEKEGTLGGILKYGIPEYRLPKDILLGVIENILKLGIEAKCNICFGKDITSSDLYELGYKAIFLGIGTEISKMLDVDGIDKKGVCGANNFLKNLEKEKYKNVVVVGGGNVAMDVARVARHTGANVKIVYRKKKENMPANKSEIESAYDEGIEFIFEKKVEKINGENEIKSITLDDGTNISCDMLLIAIGSIPNVQYLPGMKMTEKGLIEINEHGRTSISNIFAGGDLVNEKSSACRAMRSGINAAKGIHEYLKRR